MSRPRPTPLAARLAVSLTLAVASLAGCASGGGGDSGGPGGTPGPRPGDRGGTPAAEIVHVDAPTAEVATRWAGLEFSALLVKSPPDRIRVRARVRNLGDGLLSRHVPWCLVRLRVYREGRVLPDPVQERECAGFERLVSLRPGEATDYHHWIPAGRLLPEGHAEASVVLRVYLPGESRPGLPPRTGREITLARLEVRRQPGRESRDSASISCRVRDHDAGRERSGTAHPLR